MMVKPLLLFMLRSWDFSRLLVWTRTCPCCRNLRKYWENILGKHLSVVHSFTMCDMLSLWCHMLVWRISYPQDAMLGSHLYVKRQCSFIPRSHYLYPWKLAWLYACIACKCSVCFVWEFAYIRAEDRCIRLVQVLCLPSTALPVKYCPAVSSCDNVTGPLEQGYIRPSANPYGAPVLFVLKNMVGGGPVLITEL